MSLFFNLFKGYKKDRLKSRSFFSTHPWYKKPAKKNRTPSKKSSIPPWQYFIKSYICPHTKRPYRLVAQDSGFSFPQQRFETAWGYKKNSTQVGFFFYTLEQTATKGIKKSTARLAFFVTAKSRVARPINGKSPSNGGRQYFTSWNERLLNKLLIHQNRSLRFLLSRLFR